MTWCLPVCRPRRWRHPGLWTRIDSAWNWGAAYAKAPHEVMNGGPSARHGFLPYLRGLKQNKKQPGVRWSSELFCRGLLCVCNFSFVFAILRFMSCNAGDHADPGSPARFLSPETRLVGCAVHTKNLPNKPVVSITANYAVYCSSQPQNTTVHEFVELCTVEHTPEQSLATRTAGQQLQCRSRMSNISGKVFPFFYFVEVGI